MSYLKYITQIFFLIFVFKNSYADILIRAEQSPWEFLRFHETENGYRVLECKGTPEQHSCHLMFDRELLFSRDELRRLRDQKKYHTAYAITGDIVIIAGVAYVGLQVGAATVTFFIKGSLDGGAAIGPLAGGATVGASAGSSFVAALDALDPFVHLDILKTYNIILNENIASEEELQDDFDINDIEGVEISAGYLVTIEDINYQQLRKSFLLRHLQAKGLMSSHPETGLLKISN